MSAPRIVPKPGVECGEADPSPLFIADLMHTTGLPFEDLFEIVRDRS